MGSRGGESVSTMDASHTIHTTTTKPNLTKRKAQHLWHHLRFLGPHKRVGTPLLRALKYKEKLNTSESAKYYFLLRSMLCQSGLANDDLTRLEALDVKGVLNLLHAVTVGSSVAKVLMKKRCKSSGILERSSMTKAVGEDDGGCASGSKSSQCNVSLEKIVRMNEANKMNIRHCTTTSL